MKIAFLIDKDSVFNTPNFIKIVKEIALMENLEIEFLMSLKRCRFYDFVFSFTDKYDALLKDKLYKVYPLYLDDKIKEFTRNDLFYYDEYYSEYEYEELFYYEKTVISNVLKDFKGENKEYFYSSEMLNKLQKEIERDFITLTGDVPIIISAPHNVSQYFNGVYKVSDYGTGKLAFSIMENARCYGIIKIKNIGSIIKNDNANKQIKCPYRDEIKEIVKSNKIKALIDIHSLKKSRKEEINIGINGGNNLFNNKKIEKDIINIVKDKGFKVSIDYPYIGGYPTISDFASRELGIYSLEIEINSKFINYNYKTSRYNDLVEMLKEIVTYFDENIKK